MVITTEEDLIKRLEKLYLTLMNGEEGKDINKFMKLCQQKLQLNNLNNQRIYQLPLVTTDYPLTASNDTVLHVAAYLGRNKLVKELLGLTHENPGHLVTFANAAGDTVLHEATANDKINEEVVNTMIDFNRAVLNARNLKGETPLFKAVNFGNEKMYRHLLDEHIKEDLEGHWIRNDDGANILHIAIMTESYDLALEIAKKHHKLLDKRDENGMTGLQLLSRTPSAFKSGAKHSLVRKFFYFCVPKASQSNGSNQTHNGVPKASQSNGSNQTHFTNVLGKINQLIWSLCPGGLPWMYGVWNEKRKHESASKLAEYLIKRDLSWRDSDPGGDPGRIDLIPIHHELEDHPDDEDHLWDLMEPKLFHKKKKKPAETPLLIATRNGIEEIVTKILEEFPQAVDHVGSHGQNILHVAIKNRQKVIFNLVKNMEIPMMRQTRQIDKKGNTALHQVEFIDGYNKGEEPSPALQLKEELYWFKLVKEVLPSHYQMHRNKEGFTAEDLFKKSHSKLLTEAQVWLKRTSVVCSIIAVLIATVPGNPNNNGVPVLLYKLEDKPFFSSVFTAMNVVSLASSLTSVVMFLSILTSPFQFEDFKQTLPMRLKLGFTFLFISVATMMLAFAATIILAISIEKRSSKLLLLIYTIAFLPVSTFAFLQLPLHVALTPTSSYHQEGASKVQQGVSKKDQ